MPENTFEDEIKNRLQRVYSFTPNESDIILTKLDELKRIRLFSILRAEIINQSERQNAKIWGPYWLYDYFAIEAISKLRSKKHIESMFTDYLTEDEKIALLMGFKFSRVYKWGEGTLLTDHLMRQEMMSDDKFVEEHYVRERDRNKNCIKGICLYHEWLKARRQVNKYILCLQGKLKDMRDSIVHDSSHLAILPDYSDRDGAASFSSSLIDSFGTGLENKYVTYECNIKPEDYFKITYNCRREFLVKNFITDTH